MTMPGGGASSLSVGRPGSGALPPPTARPLAALPGPTTHWLWVRGGAGVGTCHRPHSARSFELALPAVGAALGRPGGGASCLGVGRPGSGVLPPPTARPLGGLPRPTAHWLWVRGGAGVGTRHQPHSARSFELALRAVGAARERPGGAPPAWVWGVRGRALSRPRLPALWAGCRGPLPTGCGCGGVRAWGPVTNPTPRALSSWLCTLWGRHEGARGGGRLLPGGGASGVGRSPNLDCPPSGRAAGAHYPLAVGAWGCGRGDPSPTPQRALLRAGFAHCGGGMRVPGGGASCLGVGRLGSGALPPLTARPSAGLPGCCAYACPAWPGRAGRPPGRVLVRLTFPLAFLASLFACSAPPCLCVFSGLGCPGPWRLVAPPPLFFVFFCPPPSLLSLAFLAFRLPLASAPPPPPPVGFFFLSCCSFSCCASAVCVPGCRAACSLSCPFVVLCASSVLFLVAGVVGSLCRCLLLGVCWWLWLPGVVVWMCVSALVPVSGLAVAGRPPCGVPFPCAVSCGAVLPCGAVLWCPVFFFFCFSPCWWRWFPVVPRWFSAPGRFRVVSVSVLCLCGAVLVCLGRCSLFGALLPSRGWLLFCVVACCVFAVGPGCPLLSPGGSWWLLVSCLGGVLWCVPGCCAAPCCCALCRLALRCCALCCFVLLRLVLPRAVLCPGALSFVLGSCAFWRRVLSCPPACVLL